jgi:hypothetical protein
MPFLLNAEFNALPSFIKPNDQDVFQFCLSHRSDGYGKRKASSWLWIEIMLQLITAAGVLHTITKHISCI